MKAAPTKWGTLGYRIVSSLGRERIHIELDLPAEGFHAMIKLCLRLPAGQAIRAVAVNGSDWRDFDPKEETVVLPSGSRGRHTIEVGCHSRSYAGFVRSIRPQITRRTLESSSREF